MRTFPFAFCACLAMVGSALAASPSAGEWPTFSMGGTTTRNTAAATLSAAQAAAPLASSDFTGSPTAPTQAAGDNLTDIMTDAFVQTVVGNVLGGSGGVSPSGGNASATLVVLPNGNSRTMASRAADVFNVRDYGALGTGSKQSLAAQFGNMVTASLSTFAAQRINGATPYAWMTNSTFGLTFAMPTSIDQGGARTTLTFTETLNGINNWSATVALWEDPSHENYVLQPGMLVGGSCIAAGTTVSNFVSTQGATGYGTITLSQASSSKCARGTAITFTIAPSQLRTLTVDWLGIQGAMAQAWLSGTGGTIYIPSGQYIVNQSLINGGRILNTSTQTPNLEVRGDGEAETKLLFLTDLGVGMCGLVGGGRGLAYTSLSNYHDFAMSGPAPGRAVVGKSNVSMDGLCVGETEGVWNVFIQSFHAGVNGLKDHWYIRNSSLTNNTYGVYWGPFSSTIGNTPIHDTNLTGNTIASMAVSATNQVDSSNFADIHTGFSPYGIYYEAKPLSVATSLGFLSNNLFEQVFMESLGNAFIYGAGQSGSVVNNTFIAGSTAGVGSSSYKIPGSTVRAVIYVNEFQFNTMLGTSWNSYPSLTTAIVDVSDWCTANNWINDVGFVTGSTSTVAPLKCVNSTENNTFHTAYGDGTFEQVSIAVSPGTLVYDGGYDRFKPYANGKPFGGVIAGTAAGGNYAGVYTSGYAMTVTKASSTQAISSGASVVAASGGVVPSVDQDGAIGTALGSSSSGTATVVIDLYAGSHSGSVGATTGAAAAGTTQATAYAIPSRTVEFTAVASGTGAVLPIIPVGAAVTVYNDGANALLVYPQLGGTIHGAKLNAGVSVATGSSACFRLLSAALWHQ